MMSTQVKDAEEAAGHVQGHMVDEMKEVVGFDSLFEGDLKSKNK